MAAVPILLVTIVTFGVLFFFIEVLEMGNVKLPRRKKSKKPVEPVTLNDLADSYDRTAAELMAKAERENDPYYYGQAERLMKQAKCARKQYLDELMEL